ncbi:hypothetical protein B484DRAFT_454125 [Ochromonadaceae sp. CCMP2298]|nr:hypothetical protein B484DRAFT_454125 [Ochromonadaceae sp. CCMP2298]|mmetsp:Transcript_21409/g.48475  ORF Transcript_21409/g.48475 Transcript_21409/m.48475 type:complete len:326 (+) Transcript_21409:130-1107(+)
MLLNLCSVALLLSLWSADGFVIRLPLRTLRRYNFNSVCMNRVNPLVLRATQEESQEDGGDKDGGDGDAVVDYDEGGGAAEEDEGEEFLEEEEEEKEEEAEMEIEAVDPVKEAIREREMALAAELSLLDGQLRTERKSLTTLRDKISESGKNGYFIVQAQVSDFMKKRDAEQKRRVERNKREFVEKMLPVVDAFRAAPSIAPATEEKGETMHKSFSSLLDSLIIVFEMYGYTEYAAVVGEKLDPFKHQIIEVRQTEEGEMNVILEAVRTGVMDPQGVAMRKASVVVSTSPIVEVSQETHVEEETEAMTDVEAASDGEDAAADDGAY